MTPFQIKTMSDRSGDRQVEILEQFLLDLDECYGGEGEAAMVHEVKCSVRTLVDRVTQRRIEKVAEVTRQGKAQKAHQLMRHYFPNVTLAIVEDVLQLVYLHAENLQSAIEFAALIEPWEMLLDTFKALIVAVKFKKHTDELEMLLLKKYIVDLEIGHFDEAEQYYLEPRDMTDEVRAACARIIQRMCTELENNDLSMVNQISSRFGHQLLDLTLSEVVAQSFCNDDEYDDAPTFEKVLQLIDCGRKLPLTSNRCSLVEAIWRSIAYNAEQAMHLFVFARAVHEETQFSKVEPAVQKMLLDTIRALSVHKEEFVHYFKHLTG
jgi:hypothetical protein